VAQKQCNALLIAEQGPEDLSLETPAKEEETEAVVATGEPAVAVGMDLLEVATKLNLQEASDFVTESKEQMQK
jgi:hypothetical protein